LIPKSMYSVLSTTDNASSLDMNRIPKDGESVLLEWQHNLCRGARASAEDVPDDLAPKLHAMALQTMRAMNLCFASVDIVEVRRENSSSAVPDLRVLEVNAGVMMEFYMQQHPEDEKRCKAIYEDALKLAMARAE